MAFVPRTRSGVWGVLSTPLLVDETDKREPGERISPTSPRSPAERPIEAHLAGLEHIHNNRVRRTDGLEAFFDATRAQLRMLYATITIGERTAARCLSELQEFFGLTSAEVNPAALEALMISVASRSAEDELTFDEFEACASALKMNVLLSLGALDERESGRLTVADYSRTRLDQRPILSQNLRAWLHDGRPAWASNRWCHLHGDARQCLQLLAIKYGIHPLALEDALVPTQQRSKAALFDGHLFILFPSIAVMRRPEKASQSRGLLDRSGLLGSSSSSLLGGAAPPKTPTTPRIEISLVSIFLLTPAVDTIVTAAAGTSSAFERVTQRLERGYSLLRQSSCLLLLHRLLDYLVDEIVPASDELERVRMRHTRSNLRWGA